MIVVRRQTRLPVPVDVVWAWMSDVERLVTADVLHQSVRFLSSPRQGVGVTLLVPHGLRYGPRMTRRLRITSWEEQRRIRWTDVDVSPRWRTYVFPHAEEFRLLPLDERTTLLTDTVRGALNIRLPVIGALAEMLLEILVVRQVVRHQARHLRVEIEAFYAGLPAARG